MHTDRYTKFALTVIAASLVWQCALTLGASVHAQQSSRSRFNQITDAAKPVVIVGWGEMNERGEVVTIYTKTTSRGVVTDPVAAVRLPYTSASPLPVGVEGAVRISTTERSPIAVALTQVSRAPGASWDPVATKVEPADTRKTPGDAPPSPFQR